jgi:hypothetical protein
MIFAQIFPPAQSQTVWMQEVPQYNFEHLILAAFVAAFLIMLGALIKRNNG